MVKKKRKAYTEAFRREAVSLADQPGRTASDVAEALGIHVGQIYNWRTQFNKLSKRQFTVADGTNYAKAEPEECSRYALKLKMLERARALRAAQLKRLAARKNERSRSKRLKRIAATSLKDKYARR